MRILLMRHAHALSRAEANVAYDAERPLSSTGRTEAQAAAQLLRALGALPDTVVCSPFVRAQETAALICRALGAGRTPQALSSLAPGSGPEDLLRAVVNYRRNEQAWLLAVMHEPDVSQILGSLLLRGAPFPLPVAPSDLYALDVQVACVDCCGRLLFALSPAALARAPLPPEASPA